MNKIILIVIGLLLMSNLSFAEGACPLSGGAKMNCYDKISQNTAVKDGVKEIPYEEFTKIRNSGENYVLLDVLSAESYRNGHIKGAANFPVGEINAETAAKRLSKNQNIIVYCGSFMCSASTSAAKKLSGLGYDVLDYKGGLKEWQEKGNQLVK